MPRIRQQKIPTASDGEWIQPRMRRFSLMCCDCGLVHHFNFRIVRQGRRERVQFQAFRAPRLTGGARKSRKFQKR
jgi:hypothetical protein